MCGTWATLTRKSTQETQCTRDVKFRGSQQSSRQIRQDSQFGSTQAGIVFKCAVILQLSCCSHRGMDGIWSFKNKENWKLAPVGCAPKESDQLIREQNGENVQWIQQPIPLSHKCNIFQCAPAKLYSFPTRARPTNQFTRYIQFLKSSKNLDEK